MARAGEIGALVYAAVPELLKPGISEIEVGGRLTGLAMAMGHQNMLRIRGMNNEMYTWHVISGESGVVPGHLDAAFSGSGLSPAFPMGAGLKSIRPREPVLIDFGTCYNGYLVDQTRMFSIGPPDSKYVKAYEFLCEIEAALMERLRPGASCSDLYEFAVDLGRRNGFEDAFLGPRGSKTVFVGHGVGLEINDFPFLAAGHDYRIEAGMTLALELKMVLGGGAVGLENTLVVLEEGVRKLTVADESFIMVESP
jgi:Xaa-Pro aminopeptidase